MSMLHQMLATRVVEALRDQEHVLIAPTGDAALCQEVASIIAPALPTITPHLANSRVVNDEPTSTFGHVQADDAVEHMVAQIADQLMESDHVDDIFADDRIIKRDAFRAIRDTLLGYARGQVDADDGAQDTDGFEVALDTLGYVVRTVISALDEERRRGLLERAAESVGATLLSLDAEQRTASFDLLGGAEVGRLSLEEAITEEATELVEQEQVALPMIEQVFALQDADARDRLVQQSLHIAAARTQARTDCAASCIAISPHRVAITLTPLSEQSAMHAQDHFDAFLEVLEEQLALLSATTPGADPPPPNESESAVGAQTDAIAPSSPGAPESSRVPRGHRGHGRARTSCTRHTRSGRSTHRAKG